MVPLISNKAKQNTRTHVCIYVCVYVIYVINIQKRTWKVTILILHLKRLVGLEWRNFALSVFGFNKNIFGYTTDRLQKTPGRGLSLLFPAYFTVLLTGDLGSSTCIWSPSASSLHISALPTQKRLTLSPDSKYLWQGLGQSSLGQVPILANHQGDRQITWYKMTRGDYFHFILQKDEAQLCNFSMVT